MPAPLAKTIASRRKSVTFSHLTFALSDAILKLFLIIYGRSHASKTGARIEKHGKEKEKGMKRKPLIVGSLALLMSFLFSALLLPVLGASDAFDGDFSRVGSASTVILGGADVLDALGYDLSETEREYLSVHVPAALRYEDKISTEAVVTHYVGGILTIYAKPYTYRAKNGKTVTWLPIAATVAGDTRQLTPSEDAYAASFPDLAEDPSLSATVTYEATFSVPKESVAALANLTYEEAERVRTAYLAARETYEAEKAAYDANRSAYDAYLLALGEYREARLTYEAYLTAEAVYKEQFAAYQKYLSDLEEYEREAEEYRRYLVEMEEYNRRVTAYNEYLERLAAYNEDLKAYGRYTEALDTATRQLSYMNMAKFSLRGRVVYGSIQGTLVKTVLENEDILSGKIVDADPYAISLAGDATERLRTILKDYFSLTTDEEKYNYYALNYTEIVNNYANLLRSLDNLYRVRNVRAILIEKGKAEKFVILLAELYVIVRLISDTPVLNLEETAEIDDTYRIQHWDSAYADRYLTPAEIFGDVSYPAIDGSVGTPLAGGYPVEVAEPAAPTPVENPAGSKPTERYKPLPPSARTEPVEPTPVAEPTPPDVVEAPGDPPATPKLTVSERRLVSSLEDGTLFHRDPPDADASLTFSSTVNKKVFDSRTVTVVFLSEKGGDVLFRTTVDRGSTAIYNGEVIPAREEDENGIYTFDGWADSGGELVDLSACEEDMTAYPHFAVTPKYRVTFSTEEGELTLTVPHGEEVVYPAPLPQKEASVSMVYPFDGWYLEDGTPADLSAVTGPLTVYPHFREIPRTYSVTFTVDGVRITRELRYGELPTLDEAPAPRREGDCVRTYAGLEPTPVPVTGEASYTAVFSYAPLFPLAEGNAASVTYEDGILTLDVPTGDALPLASLHLWFSDARELRVRFADVTLTLSYTALSALRAGMPDNLGIRKEDTAFRFFFEKDGEETSVTAAADVRFPAGTESKSRRLSYQNGEKIYLKFTSDGDFILFSAESGVSYTYACEYGINALFDETIALFYPEGTFLAGDYIPLSYRLTEGRTLASLTITDREGKHVPYDGKGFVMPTGGVDILATTRTQTYRILFRAGGIPVKEYTVAYGELPTPPPDPTRAPDASYSYTFVGWSEEITPAYADAVYDAVYESIPLPEKEENAFGGTLFRWFVKIFRAVLDFFLRLFSGEG